MRSSVLVIVAGCAGGSGTPATALHPVAEPATSAAHAKLEAGVAALAASEFDAAKQAFDEVAASGPLDHATNVRLWEQRGIAAAYGDDEAAASAAFETLLALDPGHFLSYTLSPKATFLFEKVRAKTTIVPAIDVNWGRDQQVGRAVPLDIEVLADPKAFLARATIFVHERGDSTWRAADLALAGGGSKHLVLPAVEATKPVSLEIYLRGYDAANNEVLEWASPARPREIPLRYDPPTPWYRRWWVIAIAGTVVAGATGIIVYETTLAPPDKVGGTSH